MFNVTKIRATNGAGKSFYANHLSANDYYSEKEKVVGVWQGRLAYDMGMWDEKVTMEDFSLFQQNINPGTHQKLTQRTVLSGVRFFDFQCSAPKSVSIMSIWDKRLIEAHIMAVREAMAELELLAAARIRKGDNVRTHNIEITGNIIYASFMHDTSRALDPQLHTHNVVVNVTKNANGVFKALETLEMCRAIRYAGKVYHNRLCQECRKLGYKLADHRDSKGNIVWKDIAGVPEDVMKLFSKRRQQIEEMEAEFIAKHGRKPTLEENNFLAVSTRDRKMLTSDKEAVQAHQLAQLSEEQISILEDIKWHAQGGMIDEIDVEIAKKSLKQAISIIYERDSVVKMDKVLAEALNQSLGSNTLEYLKELAKQMPELRNLGGLKSNPWVSPEEVIERELYAVSSVEEQIGVFEPIAPDFTAFQGEDSRKKQAELIHGMLNSKDRFNLFRGVAGAGKTSTLQELCKGLRSGGINSIYVIAPTNSATDVLKQEGFESSQTVAHFLVSPQKPPKGSYIIIDESGLNSLREGVEILKTARLNNYRVLFVGDARQHTAVESGDFFRLLEDHSKIQKFSLTEIYRQQNEEYRRGISECALGNFESAFERFDRNGFIHEGKADYLNQAAESYMKFTENGQFIDRSILVAPTHDEGDRLTEAVRKSLKAAGSVASSGRDAEVFRSWSKPKSWLKNAENYVPGTAIAFIRNMKEIGKAGETAIVEKVDNGILYLDNGKCLYAKAASDFIEAGEMRKIELCKGDLIQFNVNLRDRKIYNGNIARITDDPGKVMMLYPDGKPRELIDFPREYRTFKYGWVTTSHKSQGRTSETVVVAAQSLDRKAFYVALSRGRKQMALHCPEKEFLKKHLSQSGDRTSVHDLAEKGEIFPDVLIPLSEDARKRKRAILPDFSYKNIKTRAEKFMVELKRIAKRVSEFSRRIKARRARDAKYGYGPVSEKVRLEIEHQNALDALNVPKVSSRAKIDAAFESMSASSRKLSPYEQAQMELKKLGFYQPYQELEQKKAEKHESYFDIMESVSQKGKNPEISQNAPDNKMDTEKVEPDGWWFEPKKEKSYADEALDFLNSLPSIEQESNETTKISSPEPVIISRPKEEPDIVQKTSDNKVVDTEKVEPDGWWLEQKKEKSYADEALDFLNSLPSVEQESNETAKIVPSEPAPISQHEKDPIIKPDIPDTKEHVAEKKPEPSASSMPRQVSVTPSFEPSESLFSFDANKRYMEEINRRYEAKMAEKRRLAEEKEKQAELERQKARQDELEREAAARKQAEELSKRKIEQKVVERSEPKIEKKKPSRGMDL